MHGDHDHARALKWYLAAKAEGWDGLRDILRAAKRVNGELSGLWHCEHCGMPTLDVCVGSEADCSDASIAEVLSGDIVLCRECYDEAVAARKKIIVSEEVMDIDEDGEEITETQEDESALTDDERMLACYLDRAEKHRNFEDHDLIRNYPRHERRQLHGYQDQIEKDRHSSGKTKKD